jgi:DNA polymerase-3 subunit epsilon
VDNSTRDLHGALLDARLLADVYLAMTGGQHNLFEAGTSEQSSADSIQHSIDSSLNLHVKKASHGESLEHEQFINKLVEKSGKKIWYVN